jgi:starvation-inducible DNA-binding protein
MKTLVQIDSVTVGKSIELLSCHLAAAIDLQAQVKVAHWNVRGMHFIALHELFDDISGEVESWSDMLAERIGALGGAADGTLQRVAERSRLPAYPHLLAMGQAHIEALSQSLALFANGVRRDIGEIASDAVTADLLTGVTRSADQHLWKLASHREEHLAWA